MILQLVKMGCDFDAKYNALEVEYSDLGNHRLRLHFTDKDGNRIFGDVCCWNTVAWKKSAAKYDKNIGNIEMPPVAISPDLEVYKMVEYEGCKQVYCIRYGDRKPENNFKDVLPYTKEGLLKFVNSMSKDTYTDIEYVPFEVLSEWSAWIDEQEKELLSKTKK